MGEEYRKYAIQFLQEMNPVQDEKFLHQIYTIVLKHKGKENNGKGQNIVSEAAGA